MDFDWNEDQRTFRATVRDFLDANLPPDWEELAHGPGSEAQTTFSKQFCGALAAAGLLVPHWPARWGGRDADPWTAFILAEEMWAAGEPRGGQYMNVNWIGPTLMRFGSEEQQERYIAPMAAGQTLWCQGFSEPEAGSDLASLRTRADLHGGVYRINGQARVQVIDAGSGFDPVEVGPDQAGLGLWNMRERAQEIGGDIDIRSSISNGTQVTISVPLAEGRDGTA